MRRLPAFVLATLMAFASPLPAQDSNEGSRLERLIERSLSGAGRTVTVRGFSGVLSGRAEMARLTIADTEGVWLTLEDAVLDWNRAALLRGRLQVAEITAARIEMPRRPVPDPEALPTPEASGTGLRLPELPVAVRVGRIEAGQVVLGAPVLGQPLTVSLEGAFRLEGGEGEATLALARVDGPRGEIGLQGSYANATGVLSVDLLFDEAENGVAAGLLGLPGAPALRLAVAGTGPLDDFTADVTLATDGEERFGGTVETLVTEGERAFEVDLSGDLRPLVESRYRTFFGPRATLAALARQRADGATSLERLSVETGALSLRGQALIGADGVPRLLDLEGSLANPQGGALVLPTGLPETRIDRAGLTLAFDAETSEAWQVGVEAEGFAREGFRAQRLTLDGEGTIASDPGAVTAGFDFAAEALDFGSAEAGAAFGEAVTGRADIAWRAGGPVTVEVFRIEGESYAAEAEGTIANATSTLDLDGALRFRADALEAFAGLVERPLRGSVSANLTGRAGVITGLLDLRGAVVGDGVAVGEARFDPYLAGDTAAEFALRRTTAGLFLDGFRLTGPGTEATASGRLGTGSGALNATALLTDIAPLDDRLSGPGEARLEATRTDGNWTWALDAAAMAASLDATGTLAGLPDAPVVAAEGTVAASDLGAFDALAGRALGGSARLDFTAGAEPAAARYRLAAEGQLVDARTGLEPLDRLIAGETDLAVAGSLAGEALTIDRLRVASGRATLTGSGATGPGLAGLTLDADLTLPDIAALVDGLTGPASVALDLTPEADTGPWTFRVALDAPEADALAEGRLDELGATAEVDGTLRAVFADLAPYGALANRPLGGALGLSLDGTARADLSTFDLALEARGTDARVGIDALDRLLAGSSLVTLDAARAGGTIEVRAAEITTPLLTARAEGTVGRQTAFGFSGRLADIAPFVPGFSGPVTAEGRATSTGNGRATVEASLLGPAGARATVSGDVSETGDSANLAISGGAPLGLVNGVIAPRALAGDARFDLRLAGPFEVASLSGRVTTSGGTLTAPLLDIALDGLAADVELAGGRATVEASGQVRGGGRVRLGGPVTLSGGFPADFAVVLDRVRLSDPALYQTVVDARLALTGPLRGGALISGRVDVGESELRIPSGSGRGSGGLPEITHVGEPAEVRATRARAGLIGNGNGNGGEAAAFLLDVLVNAPNRIFVRGRGLDAELGGQVRLGGSTQDVAPAGRFDLIRGRLDILGRRLDLTEGAITLTGALDPQLRLVATTRAEEVEVSIVVEGPASDPAIDFTSRPELPQDEVLALLLFGRGIDTLSPLQIARLAGAVATLGSSGTGVLGGLRAGAGLADLDVTSGENGGAAVRAGAYIADNIYTDVTVDTQGEAVINLNLDLSRSVTVRGRTSSTGDSGLGVFFERDY